MCFEVVPGMLSGWTGIPGFAVFEIEACFEDQGVGDAQELFSGVGLAAIIGVVLSIFDLFDKTIERTVGVPGGTHFCIIIFEF